MIGADRDAIFRGEDRQVFKDLMLEIGLDVPISRVVHTLDEARAALPEIGLPAIIRPAFTLGGTGGGIGYNVEEFERIVAGGLDASPVNEVLIEQSVIGWKEFELEVIRDRADNAIVVCGIENLDPMGVHTGDSITVAPIQTLTDKEYQRMRDAALAVIRAVGVETGGSNIQFGVDPADRPDGRDRDEPARQSRSERPGEQGDRLPDRQGRRQARRRLHARRAAQRHHRHDQRVLRAVDRLLRHQDPPLDVREVPRRRRDADDADEERRRGDGDRPDVQGGAAEGHPQHGGQAVRLRAGRLRQVAVVEVGREAPERAATVRERAGAKPPSRRRPNPPNVAGERASPAPLPYGRGSLPDASANREKTAHGESPDGGWPIPDDKLRRKLAVPSQGRIYYVRYALKMGWTVGQVHALTKIDPWFLEQMKEN